MKLQRNVISAAHCPSSSELEDHFSGLDSFEVTSEGTKISYTFNTTLFPADTVLDNIIYPTIERVSTQFREKEVTKFLSNTKN